MLISPSEIKIKDTYFWKYNNIIIELFILKSFSSESSITNEW